MVLLLYVLNFNFETIKVIKVKTKELSMICVIGKFEDFNW